MSTSEAMGRRIFEASSGRRIALTVVVLAILPFFLSLPMMSIQRFSAGLPTAGLLTIGVAILFALCLYFLLMNVVSAYRSRIALGDQSVSLSLPLSHGPLPGFRYEKVEVPYSDIDRVETRCELYREIMVPQLMQTASLVRKDGSRHHLGYAMDTSEDPALPVTEIAREIARRAGVPLKEKESVRAGSQIGRLAAKKATDWDRAADATDTNRQIARDEYDRLVKSNHTLMFGLAIVVIGLAVIAFIVDLGSNGAFNSQIGG